MNTRSHAIGRVRRGDQAAHTSVVDLEPDEVRLMQLSIGERVIVHDGGAIVDGEVHQDEDGDWCVLARARLDRGIVRVRRPDGARR